MDSNLEFWFPSPIYYGTITNQLVHSNFLSIFNNFKLENKFKQPDGWNSHFLSDPTFSTNFLDDFNLVSFKEELDKHLAAYLTMMESPAINSKYKIISSWMTLNPTGSYAHTHTHSDSDIAGVFYIKTTGNDGKIFFDTSNKLLRNSFCFRNFQQRVSFSPSVGKILLFPGWLEHGVETNTTTHERVSVSFNIVFER